MVCVELVEDLYRVLGVGRGASSDELRAAHIGLVKRCHPDAGGGNEEQMIAVNRAWSVLGDPQRRAIYDVLLTVDGLGGSLDELVAAVQLHACEQQESPRSSSSERVSLDVIARVGRTADLRDDAARALRRADWYARRLQTLPPRPAGMSASPAPARPGLAPTEWVFVLDVEAALDAELLEAFASGGNGPRLMVPRSTFGYLRELERCPAPALARRAGAVLAIVADQAARPAAERRVWTDLRPRTAIEACQVILSDSDPRVGVMLIAAGQAERVAGLVALERWRKRAGVLTPDEVLAMLGRPRARKPARSLQPNRSGWRKALVNAGYAGAAALTLVLPCVLCTGLSGWPAQPLWVCGLAWLIAVCGAVAGIQRLGSCLDGPLARAPWLRLQDGVPARHRAAFWLGLLLCACASCGAVLAVVGLLVLRERRQVAAS